MLTYLMWMVFLAYNITSEAKLYMLKIKKDANLKPYLIETNSDTFSSFNGDPLCMEDNVVYSGPDINNTGKRVSNEQECHKYCEEVSECDVWVYYKKRKLCQLKILNDDLQKENNNAYASGLKDCSKGLNHLSRNETQTHDDYFFGLCFFFCAAPPPPPPIATPPPPIATPAPNAPPAPTTVSVTVNEVCDDFGTPPNDGCKCSTKLEEVCFKPKICISGSCRTDIE